MIIQKVVRGMNLPSDADADEILKAGIACNWYRNSTGRLDLSKIPKRLTERNLDWHQNHYEEKDPFFKGKPFYENTPFISTSAGCVDRDLTAKTNLQHRAWFEAIRFASNFWNDQGYLFYCYLFVLGKKSIKYEQFSEELRELNVYQNFSLFHPEGEVTAKIIIPSIQIERWEFYDKATIETIKTIGNLPPGLHHVIPTRRKKNPLYKSPKSISNLREII